MKRFLGRTFAAALAALAVAGCATAPKSRVEKGSPDYLEKGMVSERLKGNEFYMAICEVDVYSRGFFGGLEPTGSTMEIAAVIHADGDSGEVLRIVTMQPARSEGVVLDEGGRGVLAELRVGISVIDVQPYPRWLDAVEAMRAAAAKLKRYAQSEVLERSTVVVAVDPPWWTWTWRGRAWLPPPGLLPRHP